MHKLILLAAVFLLGCVLTTLFQGVPDTTLHGCTPVPMPTGEQIYPVEFTMRPPPSAYVGQWMRIEFMGGMLIAPTGQQCGEDFTILYPNLQTAQAVTREVQVKLDGQVIYTQQCGYHCVLEFPVSAVVPGSVDLELVGVWGVEPFEVYVAFPELT